MRTINGKAEKKQKHMTLEFPSSNCERLQRKEKYGFIYRYEVVLLRVWECVYRGERRRERRDRVAQVTDNFSGSVLRRSTTLVNARQTRDMHYQGLTHIKLYAAHLLLINS